MRLRASPLVFALAAWCGTAAAAPPSREAPDPAVDYAVEQMKSGDLEGARRRLQLAIMNDDPTPRRLYHLALVEREMGHAGAALRLARRFHDHPDADKKKVALLEKTFMADLLLVTARVVVEAPAGSTVEVDDYVGVAPLGYPIDLDPGERVVRLKIEGREVDARALSLKALDFVNVALHVPSPSPSPPPPTATASVAPKPSETGSYRPAAGYAVPAGLLGLGAGAFAIGVVYAVESQRAFDEMIKLAPGACVDFSSASCSAHQARIAHVNAADNTSIGFYVASGVLAAGAIVTFLVWPSSQRNLRLTASPTGLGVTGRF